MSKSAEAAPRRANLNSVSMALQNSRMDATLDGSVVDRRVEQATAAMTPGNSRGRRPGNRKFLPALTDPHHFGTMAALRQRQDDLAKFTVTPAMRRALSVWGATYTQAIYTDAGNVRQARALLSQIDHMVAALTLVAAELMAATDAKHATHSKPRVKKGKH